MKWQLIKEPVKYLVFGTLAELGRCLPSHGVPILTYHSIDASGSRISKSPAAFRAEMSCLRRWGYRTVTLSDALKRMRENRMLSPKTVVLTFDDGFENVFETALPILEEFQFKATVFLVTDHVGRESCWKVHPQIVRCGADRLPLMSWAHADEMRRGGHEFGSHTVTHPRLTELSRQETQHELSRSKNTMEDKLGVACPTFCYPYGGLDDSTVRLVEEAGYQGAVTLEFGRIDKQSTHCRLKRVGSAHFTNRAVLKASLCGAYGWHLRSRKAR